MRELYGRRATETFTMGDRSLTHDTKGNMTLIPSGLRPNASSLALTWDFENKMTTADIGNNSSVDVTYKWDALGRRVYRDDGTSAYVYIQVGQQTIADYGWGMAPASAKYDYVYASYIDEPVMREEPSANERLFLHRSQQFSTIALTTSSGAIAERYAYSAYGAPTVCNASGTDIGASTKDNRVTYTGREWDEELLLYHFRARLYDAGVGRFLGRDPIGYQDGLNAYAAYFMPNDLDPSGLVMIRCGCAGTRGLPHRNEYIDCQGDGVSCCEVACGRRPGYRLDCTMFGLGCDWDIVGVDSDDSAREDFDVAVVEIMICCLPTGAADSSANLCVKGSGRILLTKDGHYMLEYVVGGKKTWAHMPGWHWIGDKVSSKGAELYLKDVVKSSWKIPLRYTERIPDTVCVKNCFWTVVRATIRGL